ncbi:MAG: hypothetical protein ACM3W4_00020 [Ignavibacteriales bacterium]
MSNETRKAEVTDGLATVEFRGNTFTVSTEYDDWSVDFLESLEEGKSAGIVRGALGPNQWRTVKSLDLKVRDLTELADLIAKAMGFGSTGESRPSSD